MAPAISCYIEIFECFPTEVEFVVEERITRNKIARIEIFKSLALAIIHLKIDHVFSQTVFLVLRVIEGSNPCRGLLAEVEEPCCDQRLAIVKIHFHCMEDIVKCFALKQVIQRGRRLEWDTLFVVREEFFFSEVKRGRFEFDPEAFVPFHELLLRTVGCKIPQHDTKPDSTEILLFEVQKIRCEQGL